MTNTTKCNCPEMLCGHRYPPDPNWVPIHVPEVTKKTPPRTTGKSRSSALQAAKTHNKRRQAALMREAKVNWLASQEAFNAYMNDTAITAEDIKDGTITGELIIEDTINLTERD